MLRKLLKKSTSYIKYRISAKGLHSLHSPFIYEFASKVLFDNKAYPEYLLINKLRKRNFSNRNVIETVDFGAASGSKDFATYRIRVNELTRRRSHSLQQHKLLFRISKYFSPQTILEFGTSTGLSTVALALGNPKATFITMEGCASVASVAQSNFEHAHLQHIQIAIGNFNQILMPTISDLKNLDIVFFDGNHRAKPTIDYFNQCLIKSTERSVFIFDDIHWSDEMEEAWETIKSHPNVSISIDLFQFGIVFFKTGIEKQHFVLRNN